ncbi:hypothetical protein BX600DRAFT_439893 [Xylariales sp. PMI_506]|nr:hypothetical protein BX600DRAFT_439893 [Xylariales sp. PMI_506]
MSLSHSGLNNSRWARMGGPEAILQYFDEWTMRSPESPAILFKDQNITYKTLRQSSLTLATVLHKHGVGKGSIVPFCLQKSPHAVIAMLAILRMGAAFAPLLPNYPRHRKEKIIRACKASVIICDEVHQAELHGICPTVTVLQDTDTSLPEGLLQEMDIFPNVALDDTAYILFTSGSTGEPKGVVVEHSNLCAILNSFGSYLGIGPRSRVLQWSSFTFDSSIFETLVALGRGACICMPTEQERLEDTEGVVNRLGVNWAFFTPSVARSLNPDRMLGLRTVLIGGEVPSSNIMQYWFRDNLRLLNIYGPTETTIFFSCSEVTGKDADRFNIGFPCGSNAHIVKLDDANVLVDQPDIIGELLIEGPSVARGYLDDPVRTAAAFISPPTWYRGVPATSSRFYLTGDLVKRGIDGSLRIVNRKDTQVKIRGQRVDLSEISHHFISKLEKVHTFHVHFDSLFESQRRHHSLVAFIVTRVDLQRSSNQEVTITEMHDDLRMDLNNACDQLRQIIPSFMIPTLFVPLTSVPLTTNGKVDNNKLSSILGNLTQAQVANFTLSQNSFEALLTEEENILGKDVADELGLALSDINRNDGFVQLGGDSVKAMKLHAILRQRGMVLSHRDIITSPSIKELALLMAKSTNKEQGRPTLSIPTPLSMISQSTKGRILEQAAHDCSISKEAIQDIMPCSPLQQGFLAISEQNSRANVARLVFRLGESIDITRFKAAWETTVSALDILRTRFIVTGSEGPLQVVVTEPLSWQSHDESKEDTASAAIKSMSLGRPMALFAVVCKDNSSSRNFILTIHHAIYDLFTLRLILQTFQAAYHQQSLPPMLPFSVAIADLLITRDSHKRFWIKELEESPASIWPAQSSASTSSRRTNSTYQIDLPRTSFQRHNKTLPTYIQAAWALLLSAYQGTDDIIFGVVAAGREPVEGFNAADVAGPMFATCPLRLTGISPDLTVEELLQSTQQAALRTCPHAQFGLQNIAKLGEDEKRACDFQTLLVIQPDLPVAATSLVDGMVLDESLTQDEEIGVYPCCIECDTRDDCLTLKAECDPSGLGSSIEVVLQRFAHIVRALIDSEQKQTVGSLVDLFLLPSESGHVLCPGHQSSMDMYEECIHTNVLTMSSHFPEKDAVLGWNGSLSYSEIDLLSEGLARKLRDCGVQEGILVPMCAQKSIWVVVAMLAVFRSGGTLVPLDIDSPHSRHLEIMEGFHPTVMLVTPDESSKWINEIENIIQLTPSIKSYVHDQHLLRIKLPEVSPEAVAYCIFTSGTTGKPKGVEMEHRAYVTGTYGRAPGIFRSAESRPLQFSSFAFDASIEDICTTLMVGGTILMPSEDERKNDVQGAINRYAANCADLTPSVAALLEPEKVPSLQVLILGGEALNQALIDRWRSFPVHIINTYGPTEASIGITAAEAMHNEPNNVGRITCGRAWITHPNNPNLRMPLGTMGELLLEGPMLARGYRENPEATSAAFLEGLPWAASPSSRFYRTGDVVRANHDGTLTYIGRRDAQVKLRGQRIELGEIEDKAIAMGVFDDICVDALMVDGRKTLVAFYTRKEKQGAVARAEEFDINGIVKELRAHLPSYMIPAIFIPLEALPTTITGKRDRRGLKRVFSGISDKDLQSYRVLISSDELGNSHNTGPKSEAWERILAELWAAVLGASEDEIVSSSNFFGLGGDSVVAMRLVALSRERGLRIRVADILKHPVLNDLGSIVAQNNKDVSNKDVTHHNVVIPPSPAPFSLLGSWKQHGKILLAVEKALPKATIEDVYPCTPFQAAIMSLSTEQPGAYVARHIFKLSSTVNFDRVREACRKVTSLHPILRTKILYVDGLGYYQVVLSPEDESAVIDSKAGGCPIHPEKLGSYLSQFELREDLAELWWYASHAVFDGTSLDLLSKKLNETYGSLDVQPLNTFPPFTAFVAHIKSLDPLKSQEFWAEKLDKALKTQLFDVSKPSARHEQSLEFSIALATPTSSDAPSGSQGITLATKLQAAWAITVSKYASTSDVVYGTVLSGRSLDMPGIERVMGPCIATVPIRIQVGAEANAHAWLQDIQQQYLDVSPHEQYGLSRISQINTAACQFDSILNVHPSSAATRSAPAEYNDVNFEPLQSESAQEVSTGYETYPLVVQVIPDDGKVQITFDLSVVSASKVASLVDTFIYVYHQLIAIDSTTTISNIKTCTPEDADVIRKWNSEGLLTTEETVVDMISSKARSHPYKIGIEAWDGTLSYQNIEWFSSALAAYIQSRYTLPKDQEVIPICFKRSKWAPVVMLAIQKTRRAYAALEPAYPTLRLSQLCTQVRAQLIIADDEQANRLRNDNNNIEILVINQQFMDNLHHSPAVQRRNWYQTTPRSEDPAIVVFTSGSTGTPKAILLQQKALASAVNGFGPAMDFGPDTRALQNASFAFDIHACEIFLTLAHGGCLIVSDADASQLVKTIHRNKVNWLFMTPSAVENLVAGPEEIPSVKTLMMIGEAPTQSIVEKWASTMINVINSYGPAENTLFSTMTSFTSPSDDAVNIGIGINTHSWIVDPSNHNHLMPVGCVGELLLQSTQLAREYLNQPEETAKSFIHAPEWAPEFLVEPHERFYKTGDLVRYATDGTLRFVGRKDYQTKLNGQRFELGEVEHHLARSLNGVSVVAAIVNPSDGPPSLAAFIVPASYQSGVAGMKTKFLSTNTVPELEHNIETCRSQLQENLPAFMVPSLFVAINKIPRTASDKLDRKALQGLVADKTFEEVAALSFGVKKSRDLLKQKPETVAEITLQKLWAQVLNIPVENIAANDNFFSLGGDSIRAIRLATLITAQKSERQPIRVSSVFQKPILGEMATLLSDRDDDHEPSRSQDVTAEAEATPTLELLAGTPEEREQALQECAQDLGIAEESIQDIYPCTPLQEAVIAASEQFPGAYIAEHSWALDHVTDLSRLESAWRSVIARYDILRTSFVSNPRFGMLQVVKRSRSTDVVFQLANSTAYDATTTDNQFASWSALTLFQTDSTGGKAKLRWRLHHAVFDEVTFALVVDAVVKIYAGSMPHNLVQFKPFVSELLTARTDGKLTASSNEFWSGYLKNVALTHFPDKPQNVSEHRKVTLKFPAVRAAHSVTPATIARAAWGLVLSQYCDADDVVFGSTLSGRNSAMPDIESVCGPTVTTVPIRVRIHKDETVSSFLQRLQIEAASMMLFEQRSISDIRKLGDDARSACEFQNILVVQNAQTSAGQNQLMREIDDQATTSRYHTLPLIVEYSLDISGSSTLEATFDEALISNTQMTRILRQIEHVTGQLQRLSPTTHLSELDFISTYDRQEIDRWNKGEIEVVDDYIHDTISRQAAIDPQAEAVCAHDGNLSYRDLETMSQTLSDHLVTKFGVGRGDIIPLCLEKSLWATVAMMAVLKSGAAFAPTDASHPPERLRQIVKQLQPKAVLVSHMTSRNVAFSRISAALVIVNQETLDLAPPSPRLAPLTRARLAPARSTTDLAYVIFTSGSTGLPKGVMIDHRAFCSAVKPRDVALGRSPRSRVLQFASFSFDTSLEDTLTTWFFGGCVCIPSEHERLSDVEGAINRMRVNCAHITPSLAHALTPSNVPTLQQLRLGGEKMTANHVQVWAEKDNGDFDLRNVYGPTECTITATATSKLDPTANPSNIGFAVGCHVSITNVKDHNRLVPIGCVGELAVEGPLLAKGYLNDAEKTAESFIVDPAWAIGPQRARRRFYKTGDLAKYADDGSIICLGRKDSQVKLNGNRIETGDVETHLRKILPHVEDLAVEIVVPKNSKRSALVAFIALGSQLESPHEANLRNISLKAKAALTMALASCDCLERMRAAVPSYMVPTAFIPLHTMPQSIAKKTDRKALKQLVKDLDAKELRSFILSDESTTSRKLAVSPTEVLLQELWVSALGLESDRVHTNESFISLGGDSIIALRVVTNARKRGLDQLTAPDILRATSLSQLAAKVDESRRGEERASSVSTDPIPTLSSTWATDDMGEKIFESSAKQLGLINDDIEAVGPATSFQCTTFESALLPDRGWMNTFTFKFESPIKLHRLQNACERLIARHGALRTVFVQDDTKQLLQVVLRYQVPDDPRLEILEEGFCENEECMIMPEVGYGKPLSRFTVFLRDNIPVRMVICLSHALYDGVSYATLCQELSQAYAGQKIPPALQFHEFSQGLRAKTTEFESQRFWTKLLRGSRMTHLEMRPPANTNSSGSMNPRGGLLRKAASIKTHCVAQFAHTGFTFATLLKAAWGAVLARTCGLDDVVFGHVVTTRGLVATQKLSDDGMIGPCIELVPVRICLAEWNRVASSRDGVRALLEQVQGQHIDGMAHHGYGMHDIVDKCTDWSLSSPSSSHSPIRQFGSVVQHQNLEQQPSEIASLNEDFKAAVSADGRPFHVADIWVLSIPCEGTEEVEIKMGYDENVIHEDMVQMLMYNLVAEMHRLRLFLLS